MENKDTVETLIELCVLDMDAANNYATAVKNIEIYEVRQRMGTFLSDHNRHIAGLSELIESMGGLAPVNKPSERGAYVMRRLKPVSPEERTAGSIRDMLESEKTVIAVYERAAASVTGHPAKLIESHIGEEKSHLEYLSSWVSDKVWERLPSAGSG